MAKSASWFSNRLSCGLLVNFMKDKLQPVIFGEVLYDLFEDGQAILGGAPFNVAWHLQGFGQSPLFISRVGQDRYGEQINKTMLDWGMDVSGLQIDPQHSTGLVTVALDKGQPSFDIRDDVAYDYIDIAEVDSGLANVLSPFLYYGSLAARHPQVYAAIQQLRQGTSCSFVDINLRPPWWDKIKVSKLMHGVSCLKVNDDELISLTGVRAELDEMIDVSRVLIREHNIEMVVVTLGEQGALMVTQDNVIRSQPVKVNNMQDTVGAGDAFSSVCMLGVIHGWEYALILERATEFAAKICEQRGASSRNMDLYDFYKGQWRLI